VKDKFLTTEATEAHGEKFSSGNPEDIQLSQESAHAWMNVLILIPQRPLCPL